MLVWSGRCDSLAGGQPEHAYTDGVGGMAAAGWNHTGRGSMPTQEAKFPVDLCAFHVSLLIVRNSAAEVEEFSRCFCGFSIDEIQKKVLTQKQALELLRLRGFTIVEDAPPQAAPA